ncbi:MAG: LytTR family DNA-binding domain-containing protein [Bacteroidota bacterium]
MKVLIIEDEAPAFRRLQKVLEEIDPDIEIVEVIDSVEDSVKWLKNHNLPDLIFMDIQLSDGLSFEIFEAIKITKPVVFTTAFDEYMLRAFKVNSIDYLLKPIKKEDLEQSLAKYHNFRSNFSSDYPDLNQLISQIRLDDKKYKSRFLIRKGDQLVSVPADDISFFYTHNGVVHLKTHTDANYLMDFTLDELSQQLDPDKFFRANRQFLISMDAIKTVHKWHKGKLKVETILPTDDEITISAEKAAQFKSWLGD